MAPFNLSFRWWRSVSSNDKQEQQEEKGGEKEENIAESSVCNDGNIVLARIRLLQLTNKSICSPFHSGYYYLVLVIMYLSLLSGGAIALPWLLLCYWPTWGLRMLSFLFGGLSSLFDLFWLPKAVKGSQQRCRQSCVRTELRRRLRKELRGLDMDLFLGETNSCVCSHCSNVEISSMNPPGEREGKGGGTLHHTDIICNTSCANHHLNVSEEDLRYLCHHQISTEERRTSTKAADASNSIFQIQRNNRLPENEASRNEKPADATKFMHTSINNTGRRSPKTKRNINDDSSCDTHSSNSTTNSNNCDSSTSSNTSSSSKSKTSSSSSSSGNKNDRNNNNSHTITYSSSNNNDNTSSSSNSNMVGCTYGEEIAAELSTEGREFMISTYDGRQQRRRHLRSQCIRKHENSEWETTDSDKKEATVKVKEELQQANVLRQQRAAAAVASVAAVNARRLGLISLEHSRRLARKIVLTYEDLDVLLQKAYVELDLFTCFPLSTKRMKSLAVIPLATTTEWGPRSGCVKAPAATTTTTATATTTTNNVSFPVSGSSPYVASSQDNNITKNDSTVVCGRHMNAERAMEATAELFPTERSQGDPDNSKESPSSTIILQQQNPSSTIARRRNVSPFFSSNVFSSSSSSSPPSSSSTSSSSSSSFFFSWLGSLTSSVNSYFSAPFSSGAVHPSRSNHNHSYYTEEESSSLPLSRSREDSTHINRQIIEENSTNNINFHIKRTRGVTQEGKRDRMQVDKNDDDRRNNMGDSSGKVGRMGKDDVESRQNAKGNNMGMGSIPWNIFLCALIAHYQCAYLVDVLFCHAELSPLSSSISREVMIIFHCFIRAATVSLLFISSSYSCGAPFSHPNVWKKQLSGLFSCLSVSFGVSALLLATPHFIETVLQPLLRLLLVSDKYHVAEWSGIVRWLSRIRLSVPSVALSYKESTRNLRTDFYMGSQIVAYVVVAIGAFTAVPLNDTETLGAEAARSEYARDILALLALNTRQHRAVQRPRLTKKFQPEVLEGGRNVEVEREEAFVQLRNATTLREREVVVTKEKKLFSSQNAGYSATQVQLQKGFPHDTSGSVGLLDAESCDEKIVMNGSSRPQHKVNNEHNNNDLWTGPQSQTEHVLQDGHVEEPSSTHLYAGEGENDKTNVLQKEESTSQYTTKQQVDDFLERDSLLTLLLAEKVGEERVSIECTNFQLYYTRILEIILHAGGLIMACFLLFCWSGIAFLGISNIVLRVNTPSDIFQEKETIRIMSAAAAAASSLFGEDADGQEWFEDWAAETRLLQEQLRDFFYFYRDIQRQEGWFVATMKVWTTIKDEFNAGGLGKEWSTEREKEVMNAYQILGVKPSASGTDIKKAYKLLAKQFHPDIVTSVLSHGKLNGNEQADAATERMRQVNAAYELLMRTRGGRGKRRNT